MRKAILLIVLIVMIGSVPILSADGKKGASQALGSAEAQGVQVADEKAIRASAQQFVAAFDKGNAKEIAALWTPDCEYIDETGRVFRGRNAIEKEYAAFFAAHPGLKIKISVSSVKIIDGHAAVEEGTAIVKNADGAPVSQGFYTAIHLKEKGKWLMASVRERAAASVSQRPTFKDLDWLIGDWGAAKGSKSADFRFKWIADKKFMELSYTARNEGTVTRSGIEIIGRDPLSGNVISWSFDSTGGYGQGHWRLLKKGLVIESRGIMPDGAGTTSTNIVSRIDEDSFSWKSVNRTIAGEHLHDLDAVVLKRKPR